MPEHSPGVQQDREQGGVRLASAAYELTAIERAAGRLHGLRVLGTGCGTGRFTAAREPRAARLADVDLNPAMLAVAARRVRAPLLTADAGELPFRDAAFLPAASCSPSARSMAG
jgi:ubiquinone/menaquinone biosynthesis C-methylase UbiE